VSFGASLQPPARSSWAISAPDLCQSRQPSSPARTQRQSIEESPRIVFLYRHALTTRISLTLPPKRLQARRNLGRKKRERRLHVSTSPRRPRLHADHTVHILQRRASAYDLYERPFATSENYPCRQLTRLYLYYRNGSSLDHPQASDT
jgi:hypothetical protein